MEDLGTLMKKAPDLDTNYFSHVGTLPLRGQSLGCFSTMYLLWSRLVTRVRGYVACLSRVCVRVTRIIPVVLVEGLFALDLPVTDAELCESAVTAPVLQSLASKSEGRSILERIEPVLKGSRAA